MSFISVYALLRGSKRQVKEFYKNSYAKKFISLAEKLSLQFEYDAGKGIQIQKIIDSIRRNLHFQNKLSVFHHHYKIFNSNNPIYASCTINPSFPHNHLLPSTSPSHTFHSSSIDLEKRPEHIPEPPESPTNSPKPPESPTNSPKPPESPTNSPKPPESPTNSPKPPESPTNSPKPPKKPRVKSQATENRPEPAPKESSIKTKKNEVKNKKNESSEEKDVASSKTKNSKPEKNILAFSKKEKNSNEKRKKKTIHPMDAEKLLAEMEQTLRKPRQFHLQSAEKEQIIQILRMFANRGWAADQALAIYINSKFFPTAAARFQKFVLRTITPSLRDALLTLGLSNASEEYLFPLFAEYCFNQFANEIKSYRDLVNSADMRKPHSWYPYARAMKRKIIYHRGPTNSGKTYNALQRLRKAKNGVYCGPLRLLAMEIYDTLNSEGLYCNLITGQERKILPFANHYSCTIEMANINKPIDVAVIDEIQMIMDEYRGWAWTRALLGIQAEEIHVCGDSSALEMIQNICQSTGDEFEEEEYERFMPLTVEESSLLGDFSRIEPGDCIVAFSRREIFEIKRQVEASTKHKCCVVYGALPPETRRQQAKLFNNQQSGYDVLVASDAIGMGLNLNIRRIVFFSLVKFNGETKALIPPPMVKQIAGRAGRRGSMYPEGMVTSFFSQDMPFLIQALQTNMEVIRAAGLFPFFEQVELFASQLPEMNFAQLLDRFVETSKVDGAYFLCKTDNLQRVAKLLERVRGLSLEDRFNFCFAPANTRDPLAMAALLTYAEDYSQGQPVQLTFPDSNATSSFHIRPEDFHLLNLETKHQVASLYMWLSHHFKREAFPEIEEAECEAVNIALKLADTLAKSSYKRIIKKIQKSQIMQSHNWEDAKDAKDANDVNDASYAEEEKEEMEGKEATTLPSWITS